MEYERIFEPIDFRNKVSAGSERSERTVMEDERIIELYNTRDETAISETEKKYGAYAMTVANNILSNREDSEECLNDTLLRVWNSIPPQRPSSLRAFIGRIARNLAFDKYKEGNRAKRGGSEMLVALDEIEDCLSDGYDVEAEYLEKELGEYINRFLARLSKRDRDILVCRYYFFCPVSEIAEQQGISDNFVRTVLSRSVKKLKAYLEKENYI